ncbi:unnamed protein product [Sympodiomycopsis kandeliae]
MLFLFRMVTAIVVAACGVACGPLHQRPVSSEEATAVPPLSFTSEGFKILVVSDTHLLDGQGSQAAENISAINAMTTNALSRYIAMERPDFIVHNGDYISGEAANSTENVRSAMKQILTPIVKADIPFASTKGNHDNDKYSTHAYLTDLEKEFGGHLALSRKTGNAVQGGNSTGSDNYWLPVYSSAAQSKPALLLWFFDSRSGKTMISQSSNGQQEQIEDWVDPSVADWLRQESDKLERKWGELPPSIIFVHIPPHKFATTQQGEKYGPRHVGGVLDETPQNFTSLNKTYPGLNDDTDLGGQGAENATAGPGGGYAGQDRAFLQALTDSKTGTSAAHIHAIVSGHYHGNDWCAPSSLRTQTQHSVPVCFAKHSGFGGYDYDNWNHGARIFQFNEQNVQTGVATWIRFLTGETRYETDLDQAFVGRV